MTGYHDKNSKVAGLWTIIECVSLSGSSEAAGIEGTEFLLTENGNVEWNIRGECHNLPLFECNMFEVYTYQNVQCYVKRTLLRFAAYKGHVIEFRLDQPVMSEDLMLLTYDGWFMLQCEKSNSTNPERKMSFSLLSAVQDDYFVDFYITSKSGRKFPCHTIILQAMMPSFNWTSSQEKENCSPIFELEDKVLQILIHYLYTDALPSDISFSDAKECIICTQSISDLKEFRTKCFIYARNIYFRNVIIRIVFEVHENLKAISQIVVTAQEYAANPPCIIRKLKEGLTPLAIAVIKVFEMCHEFESMCHWLTDKEQREVIKYIRSHAPSVLHETTDIMKHFQSLLNLFTPQMRLTFAQHFVPEIENVLHLVVFDVAALRNCLEQVIQVSSFSPEIAHSPIRGHSLVKSLENDLHLRELQRLRILQENLSSLTNSLLNKKELFEEVEVSVRNRGIGRMLELLELELPEVILRLNEFAGAMDDIFDWSEFKFVFKGYSSKLQRIISKLSRHSDIVERFMQDVVDRINNAAFTASILNMGFVLDKDSEFDAATDSMDNHSSLPDDLMTFFQSSIEEMCHSEFANERSEDAMSKTGATSINQPKNVALADIPLNDHSVEENYAKFAAGSKTESNYPKLPESKIKLGRDATDNDNKSNPSGSCRRTSNLGDIPLQDPLPKEINLDDISRDVILASCLELEADKLNLTRRVCEIACASRNKLAQSLVSMMASEELVDITFCIIPPNEEEDKCSNSSLDESVSSNDAELESFEMSRLTETVSCLEEELSSELLEADESPAVANLINIEDEFATTPVASCTSNVESLKRDEVLGLSNIMHVFSSSILKKKNLRKSCSLDPGSSSTRATSAEAEKRATNKLGFVTKQSVSFDAAVSSTFSGCGEDVNTRTAMQYLPGKPSVCDDIDKLLKMKHFHLDERPSEPSVENQKSRVELRAHRVVIATQCEWFKRALLSGMKEAIDRYIEVPGCSVAIFKMFLHYLYTGEIDVASLATDQLVDFLVLVDHYGVDSLKSIVEQHLETRVDDDTAVPLLMVAYHCNINKLKDLCLHHCALRRHYELLHQVPADLRQQLVTAMLNLKKWNQDGLDCDLLESGTFGLILESSERTDRETALDPLIDEELSSLLYNMQDSSSSSEEGFGPSSSTR